MLKTRYISAFTLTIMVTVLYIVSHHSGVVNALKELNQDHEETPQNKIDFNLIIGLN